MKRCKCKGNKSKWLPKKRLKRNESNSLKEDEDLKETKVNV